MPPIDPAVSAKISAAMNQGLYDYANRNSNDSSRVSSTSSTSSTSSLNSSSPLYTANCKQGLKMAARVGLAVMSLGISELVIKGISLYQSRQPAQSPQPRVANVFESQPSLEISRRASTDSTSSSGSVSSHTQLIFEESTHMPTSGITAEMSLTRGSDD